MYQWLSEKFAGAARAGDARRPLLSGEVSSAKQLLKNVL
jgi:hypothetical protein